MCFSSPLCPKLDLQEEKLLIEIFDQYLETCLKDAIKAENEGSRFWRVWCSLKKRFDEIM